VIGPADARALADCIHGAGVAVFPADTVYGLACSPSDPAAVARLYALKGRPADKPSAVMWFRAACALAALPEVGPRTRAVLERLLPGPVTVLIENPARRFEPACGPDPATLGIRVPALDEPLAALGELKDPVMQSSANASGGRDARRLEEVPADIRAGADLVLDAGPRPGISSTVIDLRAYERDGAWHVVRRGAMPADALERAIR
jgi:L-threonylcarbamoyladenylate synthase